MSFSSLHYRINDYVGEELIKYLLIYCNIKNNVPVYHFSANNNVIIYVTGELPNN